MAEFVPADAGEVAAVIEAAGANREGLSIGGGFSKAGWGRPSQTAHTLRLDRLAGIVDHDAPELVLTARAATPLAEIEASLETHRQILAFEPPDWRRLLGTADRVPTIGGALSVNAGGPRRLTAGAARDHLLGFEAVNGRGERFKAGGKVVKNVTGYDLPKLVCGAFGTLAVLTEVTVRLLPRPETERTLVVTGLAEAAALAFLAASLGSPHEVSAAAHLPAAVARRLGLAGASSVVRVEGHGPSVASRVAELGPLAASCGPSGTLDEDASRALWRAIADVEPFAALADHAIWRLSVVPSKAPAIIAAIGRVLSLEHFLDWGGGLLWCAVAPGPEDGGASVLRAAIARSGGGHATLVRAHPAIRAAVPVFEPEAGPLAALSARVKDAFDPYRILNPGRLRPDLSRANL